MKMDVLLHAIENNDIAEVKLLWGTNRETIMEVGLSYLLEFTNDAEMFCTLIRLDHNHCRQSFLIEAITEGKDLKMIKALVSLDKDCVNREGWRGATPLMEAVNCGREVSLIKFLFENNADINSQDCNDRFPLHYARNIEVVKLLIEYGAQINCVDGQGCTPLMAAIEDGRDRMFIRDLIKFGADVEKRNHHGETSLHSALYFKFDEGVIDEICTKTDDFNAENKHGLTPLCYAFDKTYEGRPAYRTYFIHKLIKKGFDMNDKVFMYAVQNCENVELIESILKYVDIKCVDEEGNCVIHHVRDPEILSMLARRGAPVNHENYIEMSPLVYNLHLSSCRIDTLECLINWGSDIRKLDCMFNADRGLDFRFPVKILYSLISYYMNFSLKRKCVVSFLSEAFRYLQEKRDYLGYCGYTLLRQVFLSNENITIPNRLKEDELIKTYKNELNKMKGELLTENISYYNFCIKQYRSIIVPFGDKKFRKAEYNKIRKLFPTFFYDILIKIRINLRINKRKKLLSKLMNINFGKRREKDNNSFEDEDSSCDYVVLDCDSMDILGSYMNKRDIKSLLAAAIID